MDSKDYIFTNYKQYLKYIADNICSLDGKNIKKYNALCNKALTKTGNLKKKYTNEEVCVMFKEFCDNVGIKDYYVY